MTDEKQKQILPTVTIILPLELDSLNIFSCLESLIQQKYHNLKIIVIDNGLKRKKLNRISGILAKTDFMRVIWKQEHLKHSMFWTRIDEIHGDLIFLASPYVVYERDCIKNLVSKIQEDQRIKAVKPQRHSDFNQKSITQKCLSTIESSINYQGDTFEGTSTNGILFWRENIEEVLYWDLIQDGYLETVVTRLQKWSNVVNVSNAKCQQIQPQSFLEFIRSVYLEARYNRPHLPFRTHTSFSAISMVLFVLIGVIMEIFSDLQKLFNGQIILTFLIPLYFVLLLPRLLNWNNIEWKWILAVIPILRVLSAFPYVLGILQKHSKLGKILTIVVAAPETTILPTIFVLLFLKNLNYTLTIRIILQLFYLGFVISLTLFKGSKLVNHLFYGFMLSSPVNLFLTWIQNEESLFGNTPPFLLTLADPLVFCLIIGSLAYLPLLMKRV